MLGSGDSEMNGTCPRGADSTVGETSHREASAEGTASPFVGQELKRIELELGGRQVGACTWH